VRDSAGHSWTGPSPVFGQHNTAIVQHGDGWQVTWIQSATIARRVNLDSRLRQIGSTTTIEIPRSAGAGIGGQGFLDCGVDAEPIWTDRHRYIDLGGARLYLW